MRRKKTVMEKLDALLNAADDFDTEVRNQRKIRRLLREVAKQMYCVGRSHGTCAGANGVEGDLKNTLERILGK